MSLIITKCGIPKVFRGALSKEITSDKDFPFETKKRLAKSDKAEINAFLQSLIPLSIKAK